jgi:esterase/lipase superfamily enzyme
MHHYIITNRPVQNVNGVERIVDSADANALPVFRIALFDPHAYQSDQENYQPELVPDTEWSDYKELQSGDSKSQFLAGSKRLFLELHQKMSKHKEQDSKGDTLFFIHGFNYSFKDSLKHLGALHKHFVEAADSPIESIVYFAWPSKGRITQYFSDQRNAHATGAVLARLFLRSRDFLEDYFGAGEAGDTEDSTGNHPHPCRRRIHLAAHSMGNQVLEHCLRNLGADSGYVFPLFQEILLLNADVDDHALHKNNGLANIHHIGRRIHVYCHQSDDALRFSGSLFKNNQKRLGFDGPPRASLNELPPRTVIVDTTYTAAASVREILFDHWGYLKRKAVTSDIRAVLRGESAAKIEPRECVVPGILYRFPQPAPSKGKRGGNKRITGRK